MVLDKLERAGLLRILAPFPFLVLKLRSWSGKAANPGSSRPVAYSHSKLSSNRLNDSYRPTGDTALMREILETLAAALGDKVLDNVHPSCWALLRKSLRENLDSHGAFITRVAPQDLTLPGLSFRFLLRKWATAQEDGTCDERAAAAGLWEQALGASADLADLPGLQTISRFSAEINDLRAPTSALKQSERNLLNRFLDLFSDSLDESWSSYTLGSVIDALSEDFHLSAIRRSADYSAASRQPMLLFTRIT